MEVAAFLMPRGMADRTSGRAPLLVVVAIPPPLLTERVPPRRTEPAGDERILRHGLPQDGVVGVVQDGSKRRAQGLGRFGPGISAGS